MELLIALLVIVITWCLLMALGVGVFWWKLERSNRVVPSRPTPAPVTWLVSPARPAQLHRRLRNAVAPGHQPPRKRAEAPTPGSLPALRRDLEDQAVTVDHHLVQVANRPRAYRRHELVALDVQVRQVEALSQRVRQLEFHSSANPPPGARPIPQTDTELHRLAQSVQHHEQAFAELNALERANGLGDLEALLRPAAPADRAASSAPMADPLASRPAPPTPDELGPAREADAISQQLWPPTPRPGARAPRQRPPS